jgi:hypothetical protein
MKNRILKFTDFKTGTPEQKPEKQIEVAGGMPKAQKEKTFDQVKRAKLAQLDKTEPDYSKVRDVNEDTAAAAAKLAALEIKKSKIALEADKKKAQDIAQVDQEIAVARQEAAMAAAAATTSTTTAAPVPTPPPAPAPAA